VSYSTTNTSFPETGILKESATVCRTAADKSVLFVDDEPNVLSGLRRMLRPMRGVWEMEFLDSGEQALARMAERPFAVVVTDMRMPGLDGAGLLKEVMQRHPQTVRIILSGQSDQAGVLKSVGCAHQFLQKPCDPETLLDRISRIFTLRDQLANPTIARLVAGTQSLPAAAEVYQSLLQEIQSSCASINRIGEIIAQDIALSAKLLRFAISSFFGQSRAVSSPAQAAKFMGLDNVKSLVLISDDVAACHGPHIVTLALNRLTRHSLLVGARARAIAEAERCSQQQIDEAFVAGILHDVGHLVFMTAMPEQYVQFLQNDVARTLAVSAAERELFGAARPEVGAYLLTLWGLPQSVVDAVANYHQPEKSAGSSFTPLTALHIADASTHESADPIAAADAAHCSPVSLLDLKYLERLGLTDRLAAWRETCRSVRTPQLSNE
jgi:HD-like signal output (HDOD) protein